MSKFSRRSFLAASAALAAAPALGPVFGAVPAFGDVDVAIVGAGAAGIAAARRIAAGGRRFALIEAAERIGGRCITDTASLSMPFDRGAHWLYARDSNPIMQLTAQTGLDVYPAPRGQKLRIGRRNAREGELEDFLAGLFRSKRAIVEAARGKADIACSRALPKDLGDWQRTVEFVLGPYAYGRNLSEISAMDFAHSAERDLSAFCRQGLGALLAKLGGVIPVLLGAPATRIDWANGAVETAKGIFRARAIIVTTSIGVLDSGKIKFSPDLPKRQLDAIGKLKMGSCERIALELAGNTLGLARDDLVFEKSEGARSASLLANVSGTNLFMVDVAGNFGRDLAAQGEKAMTAFATDWLADLFGNDVKTAIKKTAVTRWNAEPWTLGAMSVAAPGGENARKALLEPLRDRLWFAGEAAHETMWGTLGGAWESGERAADAILKKIGRR
ncbi:MAG: NAD(P)/FAD-dependent oxidoreductase [Hyphomicrobiales bacterium]